MPQPKRKPYPLRDKTEKPILKQRGYSMRARLTNDERSDLERIRRDYGISVEALAKGVLDNIRPLMNIEPSPKLVGYINLFLHTGNPVDLMMAREEHSRITCYDIEWQRTREIENGLVPWYRDEEHYKRITGNDDWSVYARRLESCHWYEDYRSEYPLIRELYPTFRHWEACGMPDLKSLMEDEY